MDSDASSVVPEVLGGGLPEASVTASSTALMIVDMQYVDAHRDFGIGAAGRRNGRSEQMEYYFARLEQVAVPNIRRLLDACRERGVRPIHVRVTNLAGDSSDTSWRYKMMDILVPPGSQDGEFIEELAPLPGEVVLSKTTSNVFVSTHADFLLRNMKIDTLIVTGVVTNNCVESSVRTAGDLGYRVLLVGDACAAFTEEGHEAALRHLHGNYATVKTTEQALAEIAAATGAREPAAVG